MGKMEISRNEKKILKKFESIIGYKFKDRAKLKRALTHKSYAYENKLSYEDHNERYEYLGDAVIELCVSSMLFSSFPDKPEGELSRLRAATVNENQLASISREIFLGDYLLLGKGEDGTGGREKSSILSDALEALCGSVYLDRGFDRAGKFISNLFSNVMRMADKKEFMCDYKTKLQEEVQARYKKMPRYQLVSTNGPDHDKTFNVDLYLDAKKLSNGIGKTKKAAEQEAAKVALDELEKINE